MRISIATAGLIVALSTAVWPGVAWAQSQGRPKSSTQSPDTAEARKLIEQKLGRGVSQAEILERLRQSGMSRGEIRARLQQLGYDAGLADRYFDVIESGGEPPAGEASDQFLDALGKIGVAVRGGRVPGMRRGLERDSLSAADSLALAAAEADSLLADSLAADSVAHRGPKELEVFGRSLFRRATNQFAAVVNGPVDPDYRLGPGDELALILTGDVQDAYSLQVTRDGYVVIPDVGEILVNGLTMGQLEDVLYRRLGRVYSGVRRGPEATTHFQVSVGQVRTNQVYLIGEVVRPGAYQVSALSTVFNALYVAGGPNAQGSFRRIEVRRGGKVVRNVDLYRYLLHGDNQDDIRLEQGDIVFVPVAERLVRMQGAVRRPAIFELTAGETLGDALAYAGGLQAEAVARRVQIDRILPPGERRNGVDRVLVDVDVRDLAKAGEGGVQLRDGDLVQVFAVSEERRHRVVVTGQVRQPGVYEWNQGTTLWDLVDRAQGLDERAYTPRAHIFRLNPDDGSRRLIRTELLADSTGRPVRDVVLSDRDSVVIFSRERLKNPEFVTIDGFIKRPGTYPLAEGMTLEDVILAAGGFIRGASISEAEVARFPVSGARTDTTAIVMHVPLEASSSSGGTDGGEAARTKSSPAVEVARSRMPSWTPRADEFTLQHGDRIFVRKAPGYALARQVRVTGEVMIPGTYVLTSRQERLTDVVERAGGLTREGYAAGFQLLRRGSVVPTDLERALKDSKSRFNVVLEPDDSLHVPPYDPTVLVTGAVAFQSRVLYRPGKGLDYYIQQAGGYADRADKRRVSVAYQDGERAAIDRFLLFSRTPSMRPGSTIFVPTVPASKAVGFNWDSFLTRTLTLLSTSATLLIAVRQLK